VAVVTFSDSNSDPVPKFFNPDPGPKNFKFENPTPVQTPECRRQKISEGGQSMGVAKGGPSPQIFRKYSHFVL